MSLGFVTVQFALDAAHGMAMVPEVTSLKMQVFKGLALELQFDGG
jgi:hypothetical protein